MAIHYCCDAADLEVRGMRRFALTLSNNSSRVAFSFGKSPLCDELLDCMLQHLWTAPCPWVGDDI